MRKYNTDTGLDNFILRLKELNSDLEYFSNYIDSEHKVTLKCKKCGNVFDRYASSVRQNKKIRCYECEKIATQKRKISEKLLKEKLKELNKILKGQQIRFNVCKQCGELIIGDKVYCSNRCLNKYTNSTHSAIRHRYLKTNGDIDRGITLEKLIKRDNNICYLCNKECNLQDYTYQGDYFIAGNYYPSIEHIIPLSKGGTHTWDNIKLAHRICNSYKGDKQKPWESKS